MSEQDEQLDPRLERLADGTIGEAEKAELLREAEDDAELAKAVALFRPFTPEVQARLRTAAQTSSATPRRLPWVGAGVGVVLAAAAAVVLFSRAGVEAIPEYTFTARAGDAIWRSEAAPKTNALREDSEMSIVARPSQIVSGGIDGALWIITANDARRSPAPPEVSADGALRWLGSAGELSAGRTGAVKFVAVVGRADAIAEVEPPGDATQGEGWQSFEVSVEIRPQGAAP